MKFIVHKIIRSFYIATTSRDLSKRGCGDLGLSKLLQKVHCPLFWTISY